MPTGQLVLMASGGWPSSTSGCRVHNKTEYGTNDVDVYSLDFDNNADEYAQWSVVMPSDWDAGTVTAVPFWTCTGAGAEQTVCFGLQGRSYGNDDALDQAWGTAQTSSDTWIADGDVHKGPATSAITLAGTPAAGELVQFRLFRDVSEDTLGVDAQFLAWVVTFTRA
jgi:hypothetical protein